MCNHTVKPDADSRSFHAVAHMLDEKKKNFATNISWEASREEHKKSYSSACVHDELSSSSFFFGGFGRNLVNAHGNYINMNVSTEQVREKKLLKP